MPRSSVAKWPDSGAISSTRGWTVLDILFEAQQRAERGDMRGLLGDRDLAVARHYGGDAKGRPLMRQPGPGDQLIGGGEIAERRMVGQQRHRPTGGRQRRVGKGTDRRHDVGMRLIRLIQHYDAGRPKGRPLEWQS